MMDCAIVPKEHGDTLRRVSPQQDRADSKSSLSNLYSDVASNLVTKSIPVVMTGISSFYFELKKELEIISSPAVSSLNSQSKEIDTIDT